MKKLITVIACTCCLFALLIVSAFSESEILGLDISKSGNGYFPIHKSNGAYGLGSIDKRDFSIDCLEWHDYTNVDITFTGLTDWRNEREADGFWNMLPLRYALSSNLNDFSGKYLEYQIVMDFDVNQYYNIVFSQTDRTFYNTSGIGLNSDFTSEPYHPKWASIYVPSTTNFYYLSDLNSSLIFAGSNYNQIIIRGTITDVSIISELVSSSYFVFYLPFQDVDETFRLTSAFALFDVVSGGSSNGSSGSSGSSSPDLMNPVLYDIPLWQQFRTSGDFYGPLASVSAVKFYRQSSQSNTLVEDISDYLVVSRSPLMPNKYPILLVLGLPSGQNQSLYEAKYLDADIVQVILPLEFSRNYQPTSSTVDIGLQTFDTTKKYGYHFDVYFDFKNSSFQDYTDLIAYLNSSIYSYEPFSLSFGSLTIPWDYFDIAYGYDYTTCRVSLDLNPDIEIERSFISAIQAYTDGDAVLKMSLPKTCYDNTLIGITNAGFYVKGSIVIPGSDTPTTPGTPSTPSGYSQSDVDAAFNRGYNQGVSDGSDKNYVYGFINGIFSGFNQFYKTVTQGISIGGITLSAVITSMCIICLFVLIIKKVT